MLSPVLGLLQVSTTGHTTNARGGTSGVVGASSSSGGGGGANGGSAGGLRDVLVKVVVSSVALFCFFSFTVVSLASESAFYCSVIYFD
jgi:hypothetical protein